VKIIVRVEGDRMITQGSIALIGAVLLASVGTATGTASAESLELDAQHRWIAVFGSQDRDEAIGVAGLFWESSPRVVRSSNERFTVLLGPHAAQSIEEFRSEYQSRWPALPDSAFLSRGLGFVETVWTPPGSVVIAEGEFTPTQPLRLAAGELDIEVRVLPSGGDESKVVVSGSIRSSVLFRLATPPGDFIEYGAHAEVVRLDRSTQHPQVVISRFSGGAHCCTWNWIISEGANGEWQVVAGKELDGEGWSYEDIDLDGAAEIIHADNSFLYTFAGYAGSFPPSQILRFSKMQLSDLSRAPAFKHYFKRDLAGTEFLFRDETAMWRYNGFLAAWAARKARLGELAEAWVKILSLYDHASDFGVSVCPDPADETCEDSQRRMLPFPSGLAFHLDRNGYGPLPAIAAEYLPTRDRTWNGE
jgi:hypothetical protein